MLARVVRISRQLGDIARLVVDDGLADVGGFRRFGLLRQCRCSRENGEHEDHGDCGADNSIDLRRSIAAMLIGFVPVAVNAEIANISEFLLGTKEREHSVRPKRYR